MCAMNARLLRPTALGFNPKSISGLELWLDANDSSTITISTGVAVWADKSGNGRNATQAVAGKQPLNSNTQNGKKVVTFQGTDDTLAIAAAAAFNSSSLTYILVARHNSVTNNRLYYKTSGVGTNGYGVAVRDNGFVFLYQQNDAVSVTLQVAESDFSRAYHIYTVTLEPNAQTGFADGVQKASATASQSYDANLQLFLGSRRDIGEYLVGDIAEVMHFSRAINATERQRIERYLGGKWGITVA